MLDTYNEPDGDGHWVEEENAERERKRRRRGR